MIGGLLLLYYEFFKVGLFAVGGGLATLPFLFKLSDKYSWFTSKMVGDMIAISESTPGPIGINMATYVGFQNYGIIGAVVSTLGIITPSIIIIIIVSNFLLKFSESIVVQNIFHTLRPAVTGMIGAVAITLITGEIFDFDAYAIRGIITELFKFKQIIWFALLVFLTNKYKKHPLFYIAISAAAGIALKF
ncbi:MAG TPA: chromate transporter [Lachnospiraceae bacterium]|jgi:Chromate transport protein ChrA|nr:chromate transporter [Lachnospiraceae bacterium]